MRPRSFSSVTRALLGGLDVLFVGLVVVAVAVAAQAGASVWVMAVTGAAFLAVYFAGRVTIRTAQMPVDDRGHVWPRGVWIAALVAGWATLLWFSPTALWVAFPLWLLQMHTLGPRRGIVAVVVTTALTVARAVRSGLTGWGSVGGVLGPVVGATVAVSVVLGLEALARESAERQRMVDELGEARQYLAEFDRERAVLGERERLAREIHDTLAQGFSGIDLLLRAARPQVENPAAAALVDRAAQTARDNLAEARRVVRALSPADLDEHTLVSALHRQAERSRQPDLAVGLHVDGHPVPLPLATEAALLRIAQSALANVRQHANATRADLALSYTDDEVLFDIVDDGAGFDPAVPADTHGGFGLTGMASRVRELGGRFEVESAPGRGTAVAVALPIDEHRDRGAPAP